MGLRFVDVSTIVCPNQFVNNPPSDPLPFKWLRDSLPNELDIVDFNGFVVNFLKKTITALFIKKEYEYDLTSEITVKNITELCNNDELKNDLIKRLMISKIFDIPLFLICWPKNYPHYLHDTIPKPVLIFKLNLILGNVVLENILQGVTDDLQKFIYSYRNFKFTNVKPLYTAKSYMECYLSTTSFPWPGDLDGIIFNKNNNQILSILEFKTHNLDTPIENESASKYQSQDFRRFRVLEYLQTHVSTIQQDLPSLLFIVWGTKSIHKKIKIQKIHNQLVIEQDYVDSPLFSKDSLSFSKLVLNMSK